MKDENFCYHFIPFQGILGNHERTLLVVAESAKNAHTASQNTKNIEGSNKAFKKELCLFCQIYLEHESSFSICQDSRDAAPKEVLLEECSNILSLYKILSGHVFDGMAGDLKYHQTCWRNVIDKRVPEVHS